MDETPEKVLREGAEGGGAGQSEGQLEEFSPASQMPFPQRVVGPQADCPQAGYSPNPQNLGVVPAGQTPSYGGLVVSTDICTQELEETKEGVALVQHVLYIPPVVQLQDPELRYGLLEVEVHLSAVEQTAEVGGSQAI